MTPHNLNDPPNWTVSQMVTLSCLWDAIVPKPGNVHRGADFADMSLGDLAVSAVAIGPPLASAADVGVGRAIFLACDAMRCAVGKNTHLGTILLLAPLAAVATAERLPQALADLLADLTPEDADWTFQAIRRAAPGGLGTAPREDVARPPQGSLRDAMKLASERDLVARQYTTGFQEVLQEVMPRLLRGRELWSSWTRAIIHTHIWAMATYPDSLIGRKCGTQVALESAARADRVLQAGPPFEDAYQRAAADLDFWLRSDGNRRNPGTTADLISAGLFACFCQGHINFPCELD